MNKRDLIRVLSARTGIPQAKTAWLLDRTCEAIMEGTAEGRCAIAGFGTFSCKVRAARRQQTPTGEYVDIPARTVPTFKPSDTFKAAVA